MRKYGIITIGYNRVASLKRLLTAIGQVDYKDFEPTLIISLDYANMPEIMELAEQFQWTKGRKVIKVYEERQGLRKHILGCGDYLEEYDLDAAAVFEDDIVPSPAFFNYMVQAVEFYKDYREIAGISLYSDLWNLSSEKPFQPLYSKYDAFFRQYAVSWGQIWLRDQWAEFKKWYQENKDSFRKAYGVPANVSSWGDTSWLKYHIRYCVEKNKYFVYPYQSLSTNFTDVGTHNSYETTIFQVPMQVDCSKQYLFAKIPETSAVYDVFWENQKLAEYLGIPEQELCVDLYGSKKNAEEKKYWLTTQKADFKVIKAYGLKIRPQELNIILDIKGTEIRLYDTEGVYKESKQGLSLYKKYDYYFKLSRCPWKEQAKLLLDRFLMRFVKK
ncbi:MAG: glycosyltransferase family 2 protein [Lachnospiraceae bacterium]|nr:glycosyltransferase family 2 protein [Lachnospiraceae bacterium]